MLYSPPIPVSVSSKDRGMMRSATRDEVKYVVNACAYCKLLEFSSCAINAVSD